MRFLPERVGQGHRPLDLVGHAVGHENLVDPGEQADAAALQVARQVGEAHRRADAVLVADQGPDGVAERFFVAEDESLARGLALPCRVGDPLESGQGLRVDGAAVAGHPREKRRGHEGRGHELGPTLGVRVGQRVVREEDPDLVAGQHAVAPGRGIEHRGSEAVRVGVVGEDEVGLDLPGEGQGAVQRSLLFGVRKRDRAERAVGVGLGGHHGDALVAGLPEGADGQPMADPVHGGVDDAQGRGVGRVQDGAADSFEVGRFDRVVDRAAQTRKGRVRRSDANDLVHPRGRGDAGRDFLVLGRDDLRAVRAVDLVAVVLGRVVAGRDHHPGRGGDVDGGERAQRSGDGIGEEMGGDAEARQDRSRVLGELAARVAAVEADQDPGAAGVGPAVRRPGQEVRSEAVRGFDDDHPVHPGEAALHPPA